ncbi:uncharacterized protein LOC113936513 isoform X2 [Zalophus californianus]|nr:uncharacterized protein LOC113936513 isoform X2 [Zalophus californianus]
MRDPIILPYSAQGGELGCRATVAGGGGAGAQQRRSWELGGPDSVRWERLPCPLGWQLPGTVFRQSPYAGQCSRTCENSSGQEMCNWCPCGVYNLEEPPSEADSIIIPILQEWKQSRQVGSPKPEVTRL